jgi:cytochrome c oxidase accessory protein FixG
MPFRIKRYYGYVIATVVALVTPFITIGGNHIFLLSFDKKQLQLMGIAYDMQELLPLVFLLMLLFIGIFAATAIGGRAFCGWACPQTIFRVIYRDLIETKLLGIRKKINNKQKEPDYRKNAGKRTVAILIWSVLALIAAADFIWYFVPPEDFFGYIQNPSEHGIIMGLLFGIAGFLIYDIVFLKEDFCIYVCPYSRVQSVLYDNNTFQAIYDPHRGGDIYDENKEKVVFKQKDLADKNNECTTCQHCVTVCPTHIDIRKGTQLECINCLECVDACTTVMGKLGKESLVQWTSMNEIHENKETKLLRKITYLYGAVILAIFVMLFVMGGKKENMLLNVNKTTQLYKVKAENEVTNSYYMLFQNTQSKKHTFKIEIVGEYADKFKIKRFKSVTINPRKLVKELVILSTKEKLVDDNTKDTPLKVMLKAYAVEDPKNIVVFREMTFFYPRADKLK